MATLTADPSFLTTGTARLSYVHLTQPYVRNNDPKATPKYCVTILVPKTDVETKRKIDAAIEHVTQKASTTSWGGRPPIVPIPVYDGDSVRSDGRPYSSECHGHWVFTANSAEKPRVVDTNQQDILDSREIYSGMFGRAAVRFFPYNYSGRKGVGCALNHVQKLGDGEPLSGRVPLEDAFADMPNEYIPPYKTASSITARPAPFAADPLFS